MIKNFRIGTPSVFLAGMLVMSTAASQTILHVPAQYPTIQAALVAATHGDEIHLAPGVYTGPGNRDIDTMSLSVRILGTGGTAATIIDCQGSAGNMHGGFSVNGGNPIVIEGLTIRHGFTTDGGGIIYFGGAVATLRNVRIENCSSEGGGGLRVDGNTTAHLENCEFVNNTATLWRGGGIEIAGWSAVTADNCLVQGNTGPEGGGVAVRDGMTTATFNGCTFTGNTTSTPSSSGGGGLFVVGGAAVTLNNCFVRANSGNVGAGAAVRFNAALTATGTMFNLNTTAGNDQLGGGLAVMENSHATLDGCTVVDNQGQVGGGIFTSWAYVTLIATTVSTNHAGNDGGGIKTDGGAVLADATLTMQNCTVTGNTAGGAGGGLQAWAAVSLTISHCIFTANAATSSGGGMSLLLGPNLMLSHCTIDGNDGGGGGGGLEMSGNVTAAIVDTSLNGNVTTSWGAGLLVGENANQIPTLNMTGGTISGNTTPGQGAGLVGTNRCFVTLRGVTIDGNSSTTDSGGGGRLDFGAIGLFDHCTWSNNSAIDGGALVVVTGAACTLLDCSIIGNSATQGRSGVHVEHPATTGPALRAIRTVFAHNTCALDASALWMGGGTSADLDGCLFVQNQANACGTFDVVDSTAIIRDCTFAGNGSGCGDAGLRAFGNSQVTVANSILRDGPGAPIVVGAPAVVTAAFCDVAGGFAGWNNFDLDPAFVDPLNGDFHLGPTSACRDVGNNALLSPSVVVDIDGTPRIINGIVDVGADEIAPALPGSGEDLVLTTMVNGVNGQSPAKIVSGGQYLTVLVSSPGGTFMNARPLIVGNLYFIFTPPVVPAIFPYVHLDLGNMIVLADGTAPYPFNTQVIGPFGFAVNYYVPAGLTGLVLRMQGVAISLQAANGTFATTDAHEIFFM